MKLRYRLILITFMLFAMVQPLWAALVNQDFALNVAQTAIDDYIVNYSQWNNSTAPDIIDITPVKYRRTTIAYNVRVAPSGHILVSGSDLLSPVLLFSTNSEFRPGLVAEKESLAAWIVPEIYQAFTRLEQSSNMRAASQLRGYNDSKVGHAWTYYMGASTHLKARSVPKYVSAGPLLTTTWAQSPYYNKYCPELNGQATLVGCVATAWSQLMKYWEWPDRGEGSHSYYWTEGQKTLSATFDQYYDWDIMPDKLDDSSTTAQVDAVAKLCADVGISSDMAYGVSSSGSSMYAMDSLPVYFKYKDTATYHDRWSYTADQWMILFKTEFEALQPRPVIFSIFDLYGGHEVVVDGYLEGTTDKVHINFGWQGSYDGYYDVTQNFQASYTWLGNEQQIVSGIEPDRNSGIYEYYLPLVMQNDTAWTGVALCASETVSEDTLSVTYYDEEGTVVRESSVVIKAAGQVSFMADVQDFTGWARVTGKSPLTGLAILGLQNSNQFSVNLMNSAQTGTKLISPHIAIGTQWETKLTLFNPSKTSNATVSITPYAASGSIQPESISYILGPNEFFTISLSEYFTQQSGGYIKLESTSDIGGMVLFQSNETEPELISGVPLIVQN